MKKSRALFYLALLLTLGILGGAVTAEDGRDVDPRDRPQIARGPDMERMKRLPGITDEGRERPPDLTYVPNWSLLVFQSARNQTNWDIYKIDDYSEIALTGHSAHDYTPNARRGDGRIVFVSTRNGNPEIYTMSSSGTNLTRLTSNSAGDYNPAWSPDGSKIAFQSYRTGGSDIYVMNANGSGLRRLTTQSAYDGEPDWSPDGRYIVYSSNRTGGYRIWKMRADGSDQVKVSKEPYSENPSFSPDGTQIIYDADKDLDGFQELWLSNTKGTSRFLCYNPSSSYTDAYASGWSPVGSQITYTTVSWVYYQGSWYWTYAHTYGTSVCGGYNSLTYGSYDWEPNLQTMDTSPPTSTIDPIPEKAKENLLIKWHFQDYGGSGLKNCVIGLRDGADGSWVNWYEGTYSSYKWLEQDVGHTYYLRSQCTDNASNKESLPSKGWEWKVTFYNWSIEGTATDNRHSPLPGVTLTNSADAFEINPSDNGGRYSAYFAGTNYQNSPGWYKEGYEELPETSFLVNYDAKVDVVLPPLDNVVEDWGFEDDLASGPWVSSGSFEAVDDGEFRHTGDSGLMLGEAISYTTPISFGLPSQVDQSIVPRFDQYNRMHLVWIDGASSARNIYYIARNPDGTWSDQEMASDSAGSLTYLLWDVTPSGEVHAVWREWLSSHDWMLYAWRDTAGNWSTPEVIYGIGRTEPKLFTVDQSGQGHLVWKLTATSSDGYYYSQMDAGHNWASPESMTTSSYWHVVDLLAGSDGKTHFVIRDDQYRDYYYRNRSAIGSWSSDEVIGEFGYYYDSLIRMVEAGGGLHFVWSNSYTDSLYHRLLKSGSWSDPTNLSLSSDPSLTNFEVKPGNDRLIVAWLGDVGGCDQLYYRTVGFDGTLGQLEEIALADECVSKIWMRKTGEQVTLFTVASNDNFCVLPIAPDDQPGRTRCSKLVAVKYYYVQPAADLDSAVHIIWRQSVSGEGIYLRHTKSRPASETGEQTVSQQITLPMTLTNPTLNFAYYLAGGKPGGESGIEARIDDGVTATTVFSSSYPSDWRYRWVDMTAWAGETVTLTLVVEESSAEPAVEIGLDEVTIGSSYPDLWVDMEAPESVTPGQSIDVVIEYGNKGSALAETVLISATLPAGVSLVSSSPEADLDGTNLQWAVEDLQATSETGLILMTLQISDTVTGEELLIQVEISSETPEIEMDNNSLDCPMEVRKNVYLPLIVR